MGVALVRHMLSLGTLAYAVLVSWLLLGPVGAFHHMVRLGITGYVILDFENGPLQVRVDWLMAVLSVALWAGLVAAGWFFVRRMKTLLPTAASRGWNEVDELS